jgi:two-component system phosphate regulon sensor histidine kinase PhoR
MLPLGSWQDRFTGVPTALGLAVAVLAAVWAGPWLGLLPAGAGWGLFAAYVADESLRALAALPAWLGAAFVAGTVAERLRRERREGLEAAETRGVLTAAVGEAIVRVDPEGAIAGWSPGAEAVYGYSEEEVIGEPAWVLVPEERRDAFDQSLAIVGEGAQVAAHEEVHQRRDGDKVVVALSATPVSDGTILVAADVGEQSRARDELRALEARHRALVELLPLVVYEHTAGDGRTDLQVSTQVEALLGYSADELRARPELLETLLHPEDRERVLAERQAAREGGRPLRSEYRLLARDGRVVWVRDEAVTVRGPQGQPLYVQGLLSDASERRRAGEERERLRSAERESAGEAARRQARVDFLVGVGEVFVSSLDLDATLRRVAELAVRDLADWCAVDLRQEDGSLRRLIVTHAEPRPAVGEPSSEPDALAVRVAENAAPATASDPLPAAAVPLHARGRTLGVLTLVRAAPGIEYGADDVALAQDVARRAALAVDNTRLYREVEERAEAAHVLTYVGDGVLLVDRGDVVRLWNPAAEAITGLPASTVVGRPAGEAIHGWQELTERFSVATTPDPSHAQTHPIETERGERWISISGVEFFGGTVYAFRDVTEEHRLEVLKADFVATASHELRTPLAAVYGAAQTLRRHDFALDEAGRERFVSLIVDESESLGRIVNEILLANQLDAGRLDLSAEPFDPAELVDRVAEAARTHVPPGVDLEVTAPQSAPAVAADRDKVRQVLANLIENAIKYSPDGGRIDVGVEPDDEVVRFYVRDEGLGIPADEQERIFEKFYRLDPGMTRGVGGTGLGLYICSELVDRMGGRIWVESAEGEGSSFFCELPVADGA